MSFLENETGTKCNEPHFSDFNFNSPFTKLHITKFCPTSKKKFKKKSCYSPGVAQKFPEVKIPRFPDNGT